MDGAGVVVVLAGVPPFAAAWDAMVTVAWPGRVSNKEIDGAGRARATTRRAGGGGERRWRLPCRCGGAGGAGAEAEGGRRVYSAEEMGTYVCVFSKKSSLHQQVSAR